MATTPFVRRLILWWMISLATVEHGDGVGRGVVRRDTERRRLLVRAVDGRVRHRRRVATSPSAGRRFRMSLPAILLIASPRYAVTCALGVVAEVPWLMPLGWLLWGLAMGPEIVRSEPEFVQRIETGEPRPGVRRNGDRRHARPGRRLRRRRAAARRVGASPDDLHRRGGHPRDRHALAGALGASRRPAGTSSSRMVSARWSQQRYRPSSPRSGSDEGASCQLRHGHTGAQGRWLSARAPGSEPLRSPAPRSAGACGAVGRSYGV